jgi:hypothetical protein
VLTERRRKKLARKASARERVGSACSLWHLGSTRAHLCVSQGLPVSHLPSTDDGEEEDDGRLFGGGEGSEWVQ